MTRFGRAFLAEESPPNKLQSIPSQRWRRNFQLLLGRCLRAANVHLPVAESQLFRAAVDLMYLNDYWWHRLPGDVSCTTWWVQRGHKSHLFSVFLLSWDSGRKKFNMRKCFLSSLPHDSRSGATNTLPSPPPPLQTKQQHWCFTASARWEYHRRL